ncbi:hypothetical protein HPC50_28380 [Corallococcus exiguus]|uniref:hypothetical protein n=1 Tax=Corallococcus TaxID=83461 RepID=UPI0011C3F7CA|nr:MULTISPECIES: hypothetical protein [Corallococcus]NPC50974.1 hypothetical protein [Corallococcus exiguus]
MIALADAKANKVQSDVEAQIASTMEDHAAVCLSVVSALAEWDQPKNGQSLVCWLYFVLTGDERYPRYDEMLDVIRDVAVVGLYEYCDEQIDARNTLYSVLLKYKKRSEWFRRARLRDVVKGLEGKKGERALAVDLQEYIFNQGVEFSIEPTSASGEVDLLLSDANGRHLVIDAKYVAQDASPSEVKRKIAEGLHQVSRYCGDFDQPNGFLAVFIDTFVLPRLPLEESDGLRFFRVKGVNVYVVLISIHAAPSASKGGKAEELLVQQEDLLQIVNELSSEHRSGDIT